ncbi:MAG: hypothetical protein AAFQ50_14600, partial [Pseudomonadota bacterium]
GNLTGGDLDADGAVTVDGDSTLSGAIDVATGVTLLTTNLSGASLTTDGAVTARGTTAITGDVVVTQNGVLSGADLTGASLTTAGQVDLTGDAGFGTGAVQVQSGGTLDVDGGLTGGPLVANGNVTVGGDAAMSGHVTVAAGAAVSAANVSGTSLETAGQVDVTGDADFGTGAVQVQTGGTLDVDGGLTGGALDANGNVTVGGDAALSGAITAAAGTAVSAATLSGTSMDTAGQVTVAGDAGFGTGDVGVQAGGGLAVGGALSGAALTVGDTTTVGGAATMSGAISVADGATFTTGSATGSAVDVTGTLTTTTGGLTGPTTVGSTGALTVAGDLTGTLNNSGTATVNGAAIGAVTNAGTAAFAGDITGDVTNSAAMDIGGTITGDVANSGTLTFGDGVVGNLTNATGGVIDFGTAFSVSGTFDNSADFDIGAGETVTAGLYRQQQGNLDIGGVLDGNLLTEAGTTTSLQNTGRVTGNAEINSRIENAGGGRIDGTITGLGGISMLNGRAGDVFTAGSLNGGDIGTGDRMTLAFDLDLTQANTGAATDLITLGGGLQGAYTLSFAPVVTGALAELPEDGLVLIDAAGPGATAPSFEVDPNTPLPRTARTVFTLQQDALSGDLLLVDQPNPALGALAGNIALTQSLIGALVNRPTSPFVVGLAGESEPTCGYGAWSRAIAGTADAEGESSDGTNTFDSAVEADYQGLQIGGDFACFNGAFNGFDLAF